MADNSCFDDKVSQILKAIVVRVVTDSTFDK